MDNFHAEFDAATKALLEPVRNTLLESSGTCTREKIIAQLMMENLFAHPFDPEAGSNWPECLTTEQKKFLVGVASHMGPDWAQALYRAAVFITKVA